MEENKELEKKIEEELRPQTEEAEGSFEDASKEEIRERTEEKEAADASGAEAGQNREEAPLNDASEDPEASIIEKEQKEGRRAKRKHPFFKGMLAGLGIGALIFALYLGYITITLPGGYTFTLFLPTYYLSHMLGKDDINYRDIERRLKEIDRYVDEYYLYDRDTKAMSDGAVAGMVFGLYEQDRYVNYYTAEDFEEEMQSIEGNYCGIGVTVTKDEETGGLLVIQLEEGGSAKEGGIMAGDLIVAVDGTDIRELELNTITNDYIKGPEGTKVVITISRQGHETDISCERRMIERVSVYHSMIEGTDAGYICIASFENNTDEQFSEALSDLMGKGAKGIVIDLRDDLGGSVSPVIGILDRILPDDIMTYASEDNEAENIGTVLFYQQDKSGERKYYYASDGESCDIPMVLLVNQNSASASEILTGCLHDYGYKVVGLNTYGKGIIQSIIPLSDGGAVEFTTAEYLLPSGYRLHELGIAPDVEVEPSEELLSHGADMEHPDPEIDNQLKRAIEVLMDEL